MANYTTTASDKSKKTAIILLLFGGVGLHLFYVGRIKSGLVRLFFGVLFWVLICTGIADGEIAMILTGVLLIVAFNIADITKLLLGSFRDNVGAALRAKY